jgi:predicted transposase/invertase (TIGR01784 family)
MCERDYDNAKKRNVLRFIGHILRLQDKDISSELRGEFMMQFIPQSEYRKLSAIEDAKEEGKMEVARRMLSKGVSVELIKEYTELDEDDILALHSF